ncbi:arginyl-tRNA--protein transferase 1-like isoform X2 [Clavelina lepadiformis]|uniref:arginyl-tRNA--protein transferase 1-like isoform X2 n=1 Tax=Clavelina lepadiformis TaxID=159417 RepID=UPI00404358BD
MLYSIVEYRGARTNRRCGYCKKTSCKFTHGMWAHSLNVEDYQALIDRGWRRSGKYCYKPTMHKTCCPQYAIRCNVQKFRLSKSKKKVAKRMQRFLLNGERKGDVSNSTTSKDDLDVNFSRAKEECIQCQEVDSNNANIETIITTPDVTHTECTADEPTTSKCEKQEASDTNTSGKKLKTKSTKEPEKGAGADPSKPKCKKAKLLRLERKMAKLQDRGENPELLVQKTQEAKSLDDFLPHLHSIPNAKHKLEIRLVSTAKDNEEFHQTRQESLKLYQKYQMAVHGDTLNDCSDQQWTRFLVDTPLNRDPKGPGQGYGSFHNQYWLDDNLLAVGVVDVLPSCVSSVYVYYDPDYAFLSLGVYTALSEIALTRKYHKRFSGLLHYYMGFYVHSCPKMRYKGAYDPSDLLCPETYTWVPLPVCASTLSQTSYARLNVLNGGSPDAVDKEGQISNLNAVRCLYRRGITDYVAYKLHKYMISQNSRFLARTTTEEDEKVLEYSSFVGKTCAQRMLLYRSASDE